ncbi:MAG TPA: hypothetical protein VMR81_04815 [Patescibacteria group bacterium]|nr:hypothetical protein [Patescibacteria group bacterium]
MTGNETHENQQLVEVKRYLNEMALREVQALSGLIDQYVAPHVAIEHPSVLIVGQGFRYTETIAIDDRLTPGHITSADNGFSEIGLHYSLQNAIAGGVTRDANILSLTTHVSSDFQDLDETYDIVFAFSLALSLQNPECVEQLLGKSRGLSVITAHKPSEDLRGFLLEEYVHIDQLLEQRGVSFITRKESLSLPTKDGHIWVMK